MIDSAIYICTTGCAELQEDGKQGHCITTGERYRETLDRLARADYCPCGNKENWIPIGDYIADLEAELNRHSESEGLLLHKIERDAKQDVDVAALLRIAARLDEVADYGSWQAETAGRIREAVEGEDVPKQVHDVAYCPRCRDDRFWRIAPADAEGFELLRCAGCGRDYRYKRPPKGGDAR